MRRVGRRTATEAARADSWTPQEVKALLGVAQEHAPSFRPALMTLFCTGMRRGEVLGLKWEDVDFERSRISVRRAIVNRQLTTPKSGKGRSIAMPAGLASTLLDVLADRRRGAISHGWAGVPEWVFCSETGGPLDARNLERT